jgi:cysteinyl-tRNA synthetase
VQPFRLFDSLSKRKLDFVPRSPGKVGIYLCGPTVYDSPHIGHARAAVAFDAVRRALAWLGWEVTFVRNITDVDDKIINRARERDLTWREVAERYTHEYQSEMLALGVLPPDEEPHATANIAGMLDIIKRLVDAGKAYPAGGDVYYSVETFPAYGALSGQPISELEAGARVEVGDLKRNPLDFALWKAAKPGEPTWESPWGPGRPGWHIECSAMTLRHLGESFDIHAGGKDLIFPHHENEIAQSQGCLGEGTFARYWMHNGFLNFNDEKMSKSLGNVFLIRDMRKRYDGESIRAFMLQQHYRSPLSFEVVERDGAAAFPGLDETERRLDYFYTTLLRIDTFLGAKREVEAGAVIPEAERLVTAAREAMADDFNTAVALAELGEAARAANKLLDDPKGTPKDVRRRSLARLGADLRAVAAGALGLLTQKPEDFLHGRRARLAAVRGTDVAAVQAKLDERDAARKAKDFTRGDAIRNELREKGIEVMDTPAGSDWRIVE